MQSQNKVRHRGRPRKHQNAALRARIYRLRKKSGAVTRKMADAAWSKLSDARKAHFTEIFNLSQLLHTAESSNDFDEILRLKEMLEYTDQVERQRIREERAESKTTLQSLSRNKNEMVIVPWYMHDAPHGDGLLVTGQVDVGQIRASNQSNRSRRVVPPGHGAQDEQTGNSGESDLTFINRQDFPLNWEESEEQLALHRTKIAVKKPTCFCGGSSFRGSPGGLT